MRNNSVFQAAKEMVQSNEAIRSVVQGCGVVALLIGIFLFNLGANTYIQSYKQTDWVTGSAYITDISELNSSRGRGGINYSMTYEYFVDGTRYTGEYGPLANSIALGRVIEIKYDPNAPENSTGFLSPTTNDLVLVILGAVFAVFGFLMTGILGVLRRLLRKQLGRDIPDGTEASPEEKRRAHAQTVREIKGQMQYTLRLLLYGAAIMLFMWILMHVQKLWL